MAPKTARKILPTQFLMENPMVLTVWMPCHSSKLNSSHYKGGIIVTLNSIFCYHKLELLCWGSLVSLERLTITMINSSQGSHYTTTPSHNGSHLFLIQIDIFLYVLSTLCSLHYLHHVLLMWYVFLNLEPLYFIYDACCSIHTVPSHIKPLWPKSQNLSPKNPTHMPFVTN